MMSGPVSALSCVAVLAAGATLNGSTNADRTNYWEVVPKNALELALWMESDRMGYLLPALTAAKFDNQRDVVLNERRQNYENAPYGLVRYGVAPDHVKMKSVIRVLQQPFDQASVEFLGDVHLGDDGVPFEARVISAHRTPARMAEYADQTTGRFWEVHEALMERGPAFSPGDFARIAQDFDLPPNDAAHEADGSKALPLQMDMENGALVQCDFTAVIG